MAGLAQYDNLWKDFQSHILEFLFWNIKHYEYKPYQEFTKKFAPRQDPSQAWEIQPMISTQWRKRLRWKWEVSWTLRWGCFELLTQLNGSPYRPQGDERNDKILFMEHSWDFNTPVSEILFMLRWFASQWIFEKVKWILRWRPWQKMINQASEIDEMLCQFIDEEINNQNFFLVSNMDFWHTYPQIILPYWKRWIVDFSNKTFSVID